MDDLVSLAEEGAYETFLINFVEECQSAIAEVLRLLDFLAPDFIDPTLSKFKDLLLDFKYFEKASVYEKELMSLEDLQDNFYGLHGDVLDRFEMLFQSVANLLLSFVEYTKQVSTDGVSESFINATRELEVEALGTVASLVLHFDRLIKGTTRERIFVAIYRNSDDRNNVDFLVDFLRQEIQTYDCLFLGEFMFQRVKVDPRFVESCLGFFERVVRNKRESGLRRLADRLPEALFGCLLFAPKTRELDSYRMKFYVDSFFRDQWVISLSLGLTVSVAEEWHSSAAARSAIQSQLTSARIKDISREHYKTLVKKEYATATVTPEKFEATIDGLQRMNASLKWMVLHTDKRLEKFGKSYSSMIEVTDKFLEKSLDVTLKLASFEMEFMKIYEGYISQREENVGQMRDDVCNIIGEIADLFSTGFASIKLEKRTKLHDWLIVIKTTLEDMDLKDSENSQVVQQIKRRLVQMLDLGGNLAMAHFLEKVHRRLDGLSAGLAASEEGGARIAAAADSPYLWPLIDSWIPAIQTRLLLSTKSQTVRVFFHKLAISISGCCQQLKSEEKKHLIGRAYSCYLERRLRNVLQSVPNHLFKLLHESVIPALKHEWGPTIEKTQVKEMADFKENFKLSEVTYNISNMSIGISRFSLRKLGTLDVNPKELLADGIRRELRIELPNITSLSEKEARNKEINLEGVISLMSGRLSAFQRAFIYMCDHVGVAGHDIWRDETLAMVEAAQDTLQVPPPKKPIGSQSSFPLIFDMMMKATNPMTTTYSDNEMVWKDRRTNKETFSTRIADKLEKWIPCFVTTSMESTLASQTEVTIKELLAQLRSVSSSMGDVTMDETLFYSKSYEQMNKAVYNAASTLTPLVSKIGQLLLLRGMLVQAKRGHGRLRATAVFAAVDAANKSLLRDVSHLPSSVLSLVSLCRRTGLFSPQLVICPLTSPPHQISLVLLTLLINAVPKFNTSKRDSSCEWSFLSGISSLLRHLHRTDEFSSLVQLLVDAQLTNRKAKPIVDANQLVRLEENIVAVI